MRNSKTDASENMKDIEEKINVNIDTYFKDNSNADMVREFAIRLNRLIEFKKTKQKTSLTKISKDIGIGKSTLSEYAGGKKFPKLDILLRLSDYFGISVDYLLGRSESKVSENDELNRRFGLNDDAIDNLEVVYPSEYLNVLFDNDIDTINYFLEEIRNYGDDLKSFEKLDGNDKNYKINKTMKTQDIKHTKYRMQDALIDLVDNYYKNKK